MKNFEKLVKKSQKELFTYLVNALRGKKYNPTFKKNEYIYAEGTIPVMVVAHLDTVHRELPKKICWSKDNNIVMSPEGIGGDDRCGVWIIMELLKTMKPHVLFCCDEEMGAVGASKFARSKVKPDVNFIIEFDRRGSDDAVFYDCDNEEFTAFIESFGFKESYGTFSDISKIAPSLGIAAVNLSSGYYNAHTNHEYVVMSEMRDILEKSKKIIKSGTQKYEYKEKEYITRSGFYSSKYSYMDEYTWYDCYAGKEDKSQDSTGVRKMMWVQEGFYLDYNSGDYHDVGSYDFLIDELGNIYTLDFETGLYERVDGAIYNEHLEPVRYIENSLSEVYEYAEEECIC